MLNQKDKQNYFAERLINRAKIKDGVVTLVVSKKELIDPMLKACLDEKLFEGKFEGNEIKFLCDDRDIFFKEEEFLSLVENYQAMEESQYELSFQENVYIGSRHSGQDGFDDFYQRFDIVERSFEDVLNINKKLSEIADRINGGYKDSEGNTIMLSPFEKYLMCFKIVNDVEYFVESNYDYKEKGYSISRSLIDVINNQKGCCVGQSEYLRALLNMVGIECCSISLNSDREELLLMQADYEEKMLEYKEKNSLHNLVDEESIKQYTQSLESEYVNLYFLKQDINNKRAKYNENKNEVTDHKANLIYLKDEKYNMDGIFLGDVTSGDDYNVIPINHNIDTLFSFASMFMANDEMSKFLDKAGKKENNNQPKQEMNDDFFSISKNIFINQFEWMFDFNYCSVLDEDDFYQFISRLSKAKNYENAQKVIDEYCSDIDSEGKPNKYSTIYREMFEKVLYDEKGRYLSLSSIKELYPKLDNAKFLKDVSQVGVNNAKKKIDNLFENILEDTEYQTLRDLKNKKISFQDLPEKYKTNKNVIIAAIQLDAIKDFNDIAEFLRNDREILFKAIKRNPEVFEYVPEELRDNTEFMWEAQKINFEVLKYASERLKDDDLFMGTLVREYPYKLSFASERLRDDYDLILDMVLENGYVLKFASERLRDDYNIVLAALKSAGAAIEFVSERLRNDRNIVMTAVKTNYRAYIKAPDKFKGDREIVLEAAKQDGCLLEESDKDLEPFKDDLEVVLTAVCQRKWLIRFASDRIKNLKVFQDIDENVLKMLYNLTQNLENFSDLPIEYFKEENSHILDVAMELVELKLANLPKIKGNGNLKDKISTYIENKGYKNSILKMVEKTIKEKTNILLKENLLAKQDNSEREI